MGEKTETASGFLALNENAKKWVARGFVILSIFFAYKLLGKITYVETAKLETLYKLEKEIKGEEKTIYIWSKDVIEGFAFTGTSRTEEVWTRSSDDDKTLESGDRLGFDFNSDGKTDFSIYRK